MNGHVNDTLAGGVLILVWRPNLTNCEISIDIALRTCLLK